MTTIPRVSDSLLLSLSNFGTRTRNDVSLVAEYFPNFSINSFFVRGMLEKLTSTVIVVTSESFATMSKLYSIADSSFSMGGVMRVYPLSSRVFLNARAQNVKHAEPEKTDLRKKYDKKKKG